MDMYFRLIMQATNFYVWFGTSINRESIPPDSMALGKTHILSKTKYQGY